MKIWKTVFIFLSLLLFTSLYYYYAIFDDGHYSVGLRKSMHYYEAYQNSGEAFFGCHDNEFVSVVDAQFYVPETNPSEGCYFHSGVLKLVSDECNFRKWCNFKTDAEVFFEELCDGETKKLEVNYYCYHCPKDFYFVNGKGCFRCPKGLSSEPGTNRFCDYHHPSSNIEHVHR